MSPPTPTEAPPLSSDPDEQAPAASSASQHRAARRALELIEAIAVSDHPMTLSELASRAGVPKSTAHPLLHTLKAEGFLSRNEDDSRFSLGPRLLRLLGSLPSQFELPRVARPIMEEIVEELDETCVLGVRHGDEILYIEQVEATQFMRYSAPVGSPRPLYCTSIGKLFMAHMDQDELRAALKSKPPTALTPYTKTTVDEILAEARTVRAQGYSMSREESIVGVTAVAAPILPVPKPNGILAGLAVVGPSDRMAPKLQRAHELVVSSAEKIALAVKQR